MAARTAADGKRVRRTAQTVADGVGARERLEIMGAEKKPLVMSELGCADGCGRQHGWGELRGRLRTAWVPGSGWKWVGSRSDGDERAWLRGRLRTGKGCGELRGRLQTAWVQGWLEMLGEKKPLVMSELGCADGCGREMGAENCADGCGRRGCEGVAGNGWGEEAAGDERAWLRTGNGWGEEAAGDGRAWLRGRLRTANGWGELR